MILTSQSPRGYFGSLRRKPAPEQPAPQQPKVTNRSQTLDRSFMRRKHLDRDKSLEKNVSNHSKQHYAPASLSSEPTNLKTSHDATQIESHHYAATSLRDEPTRGSGSGRDSALSSIFGTIRWKTPRWARGSSGSRTGSLPHPHNSSHQRATQPQGRQDTNIASTLSTLKGKIQQEPPSTTEKEAIYGIPQVSTIDPEIYATGKRELGAEEIYAEGARALNVNQQKRLLEYEIHENLMRESETRILIVGYDEQYTRLVEALRNWINDELAQQRIIVRDLQDDLHDGQVLAKLLERLQQVKLDLVEVTQNENSQRCKLQALLDQINRTLTLQARWAKQRWSVEGIHSKNMVEIVSLLSTLAVYFRAPIRLPGDVWVRVMEVRKQRGQLYRKHQLVQLTTEQDAERLSRTRTINPQPLPGILLPSNVNTQRDPFEILCELAPEKLAAAQRALIRFANRHLKAINMTTGSELEPLQPERFSDGLLLVFLISSLEGYFVPLGYLFTKAIPSHCPKFATHSEESINRNMAGCSEQPASQTIGLAQTAICNESYTNTQPLSKLHNVNFALQLIEDAGVNEVRTSIRAEDIVNGELSSIMRLLYLLFRRYKHL